MHWRGDFFLSGHKGDTRASSGPLQESRAKKGSIIYECSGQKRAIWIFFRH